MFKPSSFYSLTLFILSLKFVHAATYAAAQLGCHAYTAIDHGQSVYESAAITDPIACANECASTNGAHVSTEFAYFTYEDENNAEPYCICTNQVIASNQYATAYDSGDTCYSDQYNGYKTSTTFYQFRACHEAIPNPDTSLTTPVVVTSPPRCFETCSSYAGAHYQPRADGGGFDCYCGSDQTTNTAGDVACSQTAFYSFYHDAVAQASQLAKRNLRERLARSKSKRVSLCPQGKAACKIPRTDGFECIDTSSELESCGGCTHGLYLDSSDVIGTDCSAIPGVALGASTCAAGKCVIEGCKRGWTISSDSTACIRSLTISKQRRSNDAKRGEGFWHLHQS